MTELVGRSAEIAYVRNMPNQRPSHGMEYPTNTNMRGGAHAAGRERHAAGDMVGGISDDVRAQANNMRDMAQDAARQRYATGGSVGDVRDNILAQNNSMMRTARQAHAMGGAVHNNVMRKRGGCVGGITDTND